VKGERSKVNRKKVKGERSKVKGESKKRGTGSWVPVSGNKGKWLKSPKPKPNSITKTRKDENTKEEGII